MFVSWFSNFFVNLRKRISLEPHTKLDIFVAEVFLYQNMYVLHAKIIAPVNTADKLLNKGKIF